MNKNYTHITYIIDRSGSMSSVWGDAVGGYKTFIQDQKKEKSKMTFSLYSFSNDVKADINFGDLHTEVSDSLDELRIRPMGGTALYDAIGKAVQETGAKLALMKEKDRPAKVLIVVNTDGEENSSHSFTAAQIKELIGHQESKYSWNFMFVGADAKSVLEATENLGFKGVNTAFYDINKTGATYDLLSSKVATYRSCVASDVDQVLAFSAEEKTSLK